MQADGMRNSALVVLGCHDPNLAGEFARDLFEHREARRGDAVVVGQQDATQHANRSLGGGWVVESCGYSAFSGGPLSSTTLPSGSVM
jgi:hypothetical protein